SPCSHRPPAAFIRFLPDPLPEDEKPPSWPQLERTDQGFCTGRCALRLAGCAVCHAILLWRCRVAYPVRELIVRSTTVVSCVTAAAELRVASRAKHVTFHWLTDQTLGGAIP